MVQAQTPATLTDLGSTAPVPGANDISQFSTNGDNAMPDSLNYYTDDGVDHPSVGEPGQTFTTGNGSSQYQLTSLAIKTGGGTSGDLGLAQTYLLHIYSVSNGTATVIGSFSANNFIYNEGDWLQWSGFSVLLSSNATYAYSFGLAAPATGWDALANATGNPYAGGELGLIPPAGGTISSGSSHGFDATFDAGLTPAGPATAPVVTNSTASGIQATVATLNGRVVSTGGLIPAAVIYYGMSNGGTNAAAWSHAVALGQQSGAFATTISGLSSNTTYFFTASASNSVGTAWAAPSQTFTTLVSNPPVTLVSMLTYHNDNARDGANTNEIMLTPGNVNVTNFGRMFSYTVDGHIYAQPLVMPGVVIPSKGVHNVVYVATEHDSVYAFDADSNAGANGGLLWATNLGISAVMPNNDFGNRYGPYHDLVPEMGMRATTFIITAFMPWTSPPAMKDPTVRCWSPPRFPEPEWTVRMAW
jgi:hypothetical protein